MLQCQLFIQHTPDDHDLKHSFLADRIFSDTTQGGICLKTALLFLFVLWYYFSDRVNGKKAAMK
jgi:hypothetical protein